MLGKRLWIPAFLTVLTLAIPAHAQNWWTGNDETTETGKIQEVKQKQKVYLNVSFTSSESEVNAQHEQTVIRQLVTRTLAAYKGVQLVGTPDQAELTVSVVASQSRDANAAAASTDEAKNFSANQDPATQTSLEVAVFVRGSMQKDGTYRPRVVWSMSSQNIHGEPAPASVFAVDGFIEQLKKVRGEKK